MKTLRAAFAVFSLFFPDFVEGSEFKGSVKDESGGVVAGVSVTVLTARAGDRCHGRHRRVGRIYDPGARTRRIPGQSPGARFHDSRHCLDVQRHFAAGHDHAGRRNRGRSRYRHLDTGSR